MYLQGGQQDIKFKSNIYTLFSYHCPLSNHHSQKKENNIMKSLKFSHKAVSLEVNESLIYELNIKG